MSKKMSEIAIGHILFDIGFYEFIDIDTEFRYECFDDYIEANNAGYEIPKTNILYSDDFHKLVDFLFSSVKFIGYCPFCNRELTLFSPSSYEENKELKESLLGVYEDNSDDDCELMEIIFRSANINFDSKLDALKGFQYFERKAICSYNENHIMNCNFYIEIVKDDKNSKVRLCKTGQYPSFVSFNKFNSKKYEKLLKKCNAYEDYKTGNIVFAHGYGVGSYAYIRRVLEKLIMYKFDKVKDELNMTLEDFGKLRVDEKLEALKDYLPEFMKDNKMIYKILSAGIHILDEQDCLEMFPIIKQAIDIILDEEIILQKKEQEKRDTQKILNDLHSEVVKKLADKILPE